MFVRCCVGSNVRSAFSVLTWKIPSVWDSLSQVSCSSFNRMVFILRVIQAAPGSENVHAKKDLSELLSRLLPERGSARLLPTG